jgi:oligoendopeptidase F
MFTSLSKAASEYKDWSWLRIEPYYQDLIARHLNEASQTDWLADWSRLRQFWFEIYQRLYVAVTVDTADVESNLRYTRFLEDTYPAILAAEYDLKKKLLQSGLEPDGFEIPLRNMRSEASFFRQDNLPLLSEELRLGEQYDKIAGAQTVQWEGKERTIPQLVPVYQDAERATREHAWTLAANRQLADRQRINDLWVQLMGLRRNLAANAGLADYRSYRWKQLFRFAYTPEDCKQFHVALEKVAVPAALRVYEKRRKRLGLERLRPWDLEVDPLSRPPLRPFSNIKQLEDRCSAIFWKVEPRFGEYFDRMRSEGLLDLNNRKDKAPGGYCTNFPASREAFIFANSVGVHDDVQTMLHEGGHAFHAYESLSQPYHWPPYMPMEFAEMASMGMELLAAPYLAEDLGGFYSLQDAARARVEHLERCLLFWPYMAVVDAFQHWVYENHQAASDPANCDAHWGELWKRFMPGVDWDGLEQVMMTGWQRKLHISQSPFYYVEYGLAQLGAVQMWRNALRDQAGAVAAYRKALSLGETVTLPELYTAAGAKFAFDAGTLGEAVALMEGMIFELERK